MRAASIRFLEGRHPRLAQVPPMVRYSIMTAVLPSSAPCRAAAKAVEPLPRITRSYLSLFIPIIPSFLLWGDFAVFEKTLVLRAPEMHNWGKRNGEKPSSCPDGSCPTRASLLTQVPR